MNVSNVRPEPPGAGNTIARFDATITTQCKLFNLKLVRARDGGLRVYAPSAFGSNTATFAPELAAQLSAAAHSALGEKPHDRRSAA